MERPLRTGGRVEVNDCWERGRFKQTYRLRILDKLGRSEEGESWRKEEVRLAESGEEEEEAGKVVAGGEAPGMVEKKRKRQKIGGVGVGDVLYV